VSEDRAAFELELKQEQSRAGALKIDVRVPESLPSRGELVLLIARESDRSARNPQFFRWRFERAP
jgi:hypothetical protein